MDTGLEDRVAIVTGASRGIGEASAVALAREGCHVAVAARSAGDLEDTREKIESRDVRSHAVVADLSTAEGMEEFVSSTLEELGTVDVLVNNVGGVPKLATFDELTDEDWEHTLQLNLMSAVRACRSVLPGMVEQGWGRIVNVSSESGTQPDPEVPDYNASKAAMKNLTKSLSKQYGEHGIRVNTVSPGYTKSDLGQGKIDLVAEEHGVSEEEAERIILETFRPHIELGYLSEPDEVADVIVFLASENASFVTGSDYRVDGGSVASI